MNATHADGHPPRPKALSVKAENIPEELKQFRHWLTWKYEFREGKWTKPPYQVNGIDRASSTDPGIWGQFKYAIKTLETGRVDGIGFVVSVNDDFIGIDLDHCFDLETRKGEQWAIDIIQKMQSFSEFSPSGEGVHVFVRGSLPTGVTGRKKGKIEIYSVGRYLTVTGHRLKNAPQTIESRQAEIDWFFEKFFSEPEKPKPKSNNGNAASNHSDDELLAKAFDARNGDKLKRLFDGDVSGYPSRSEADFGLCALLAFWTQDEAQLDRLFRRSGLMRDKWDEKHGATTYGARTIERAWASTTEHYTGEHPTSNHVDSKVEEVNCSPEEPEEEQRAEVQIQFPESAWSGPFADWRDIVFPCTEAPAEYLWASCLVTIGLVLGRNIRIENPRALYPNFYILVLGQTGDDRKSTALSFADDALFHLGLHDQINLLRGIQSSEAIYESLARMDGARSLAYCDEFRSLLAIAQRKGQRDIVPRLGSLYYCPRQESLDRSENSTVVTNPFLSLIAATPAEYVQDLLGNLEVDGGFLNRFLMTTGSVREWKAIAPKPSKWERFTNSVRDIGEYYDRGDECLLGWTDDSKHLWTEFYIAWKTARRDWNERDRKLTARIDEHILKLAMVYSAFQKQTVITVEALITAISIGKWLQATTLNAFTDIGKDSFGRGEKVVLDLVREKRKMYRRYLQQWVHKKGINGEMLGRIITALVKNGRLTEGVEVTQAGQKKPWVAYVL